jgi:hypothetical protein
MSVLLRGRGRRRGKRIVEMVRGSRSGGLQLILLTTISFRGSIVSFIEVSVDVPF